MQKISLCITNYNRNAYLFKSFEQVLYDSRISEIVIVDDCSDINLYNDIYEKVKYNAKIKLFRNEKNLGCYANKHKSVLLASGEYVIIFDSDNVIDTQYLDKIFEQEWNNKIAFAPDFAKPVFDYRKFGGVTFNKTNVSKYAFEAGFDCLINTMNYFIHRDSYLSIYQEKENIIGADSIYLNYLWLMAGNEIKCLKGLEYFHRVEHDGVQQRSNYVTFAKDSEPICKQLINQIANMR